MRAVDLIRRKRDGGELSAAEIRFLVGGIARIFTATLDAHRDNPGAALYAALALSLRYPPDLTARVADLSRRSRSSPPENSARPAPRPARGWPWSRRRCGRWPQQ